MAITRIGSLTEIESNADYSGSVTVPSDAEIMLVGVSGFYATVGNMATGVTINSAAMTKIAADGSDTAYQGSIFYKVSPSTGSQTLAVDFVTVSSGAKIVYGFYKGIDTASAVRDSEGSQDTENPHTTKTLTALSGDLIVAWSHSFSGESATCAWTSATKVSDFGTPYNNAVGSWAERSPTGNQTVSSSWTPDADGGITAVVLKPAEATASIELEGFRFRNDDGSESSATWKAGQDTDITAPKNENTRIRFLINATGDFAATQFQLEYRKSGESNWLKVNN